MMFNIQVNILRPVFACHRDPVALPDCKMTVRQQLAANSILFSYFRQFDNAPVRLARRREVHYISPEEKYPLHKWICSGAGKHEWPDRVVSRRGAWAQVPVVPPPRASMQPSACRPAPVETGIPQPQSAGQDPFRIARVPGALRENPGGMQSRYPHAGTARSAGAFALRPGCWKTLPAAERALAEPALTLCESPQKFIKLGV
jgi:hypothetical protein